MSADNNRKHTSVKLPNEIRQPLEELAKREHRTVSNMILVALSEWLAHRQASKPSV